MTTTTIQQHDHDRRDGAGADRPRVLGICGSLRRDSHNGRLLAAIGRQLAPAVELELWHGLKDVPAFDPDDSAGPRPAGVRSLTAAIERSDAVLIATPEYNHSIPGQLKNALDWLSRPLASSPLRDKPVAVVGASTGVFGALWAQAELRKVLDAIGARVIDAELPVGRVAETLPRDGDGDLADPALALALSDLLAELAAQARVGAVRVAV